MSDLITAAKEIERLVRILDEIKVTIKPRGEERARAIANYDKSLAIAIVKLKALQKGQQMDLQGEKIEGPIPTTNIKELAKGMCYEELIAKEEADALYKSAITNINVAQAQLSAYQSINRHMN